MAVLRQEHSHQTARQTFTPSSERAGRAARSPGYSVVTAGNSIAQGADLNSSSRRARCLSAVIATGSSSATSHSPCYRHRSYCPCHPRYKGAGATSPWPSPSPRTTDPPLGRSLPSPAAIGAPLRQTEPGTSCLCLRLRSQLRYLTDPARSRMLAEKTHDVPCDAVCNF
jgi:hypothetical protein